MLAGHDCPPQYHLIPVRSPGVEVRKVRTIEGWHHGNEVFRDNVEVPVENRVGDEGVGWSYGKYLLKQERISDVNAAGLFRQLRKVRRLVAAASPDAGQRTIKAIAAGQPIGVALSALKIVSTRLAQRSSEVALDMTG